MALVRYFLSDTGIPVKDRQAALDRIFSDPGIPTPNPTSSFWLRTPHPELSKIQSAQLPAEADVVIIGSGITAASIARTLLEESTDSGTKSSKPSIVILEARDVCSGATGRNGGHILETAEDFTGFEATFGLDIAKRIMKFRLAHRPELLKVAEEYGLTEKAQVRKVQFLSVHFDEERWRASASCIQRFKECMPEEAAEWKLIGKEDIPKVCKRDICTDLDTNIITRSILFPEPAASSQALQEPCGPTGSSPGCWTTYERSSQTIFLLKHTLL
jgi:cation diffusion facilitator CzcD-associated flavoprotein CzcO